MGYPGQKQYQILAEKLDVSDRVTITGRIAYPYAPAHLSLGSVAVSAKMSSTEGSGKVLNYMAMAIPTIVYDSPVHREYLTDLGLYVPSGDIVGLAEMISKTIDGSDQSSDLGSSLRQRAIEHYSWIKAAERIIKLYEELISNPDRKD